MRAHHQIHISAALLCAAALSAACDRGNATQRQAEEPAEVKQTPPVEAAPEQGSTEEAEPTPPEPEPAPAPKFTELAESPRVDLLLNRYRWHTYGDGLLIPFAAEGFRKYSQEYRRPFEEAVELDGRAGRVMDRRAAMLRVPWHEEGAATARIWVHGVASGQRVQLNVNGKLAGVVQVPREWTQITIPIKDGLLRAGENEVLLQARSSGRVKGSKTYGLFHAMEIVPGEAEAAEGWPQLAPHEPRTYGGVEKLALAGFERMKMYVEVPETGWLDLHTGAASAGATFTVRAQTFDGEPQTLLEVEAQADQWERHQVDLAPFAGRLIALELVTTGDGAWGEPYIGLTKAEVRERPAPVENVILLVVDALRSDRLKLYGDSRVATPRMTAAGDQGVVFLHNQAASPSSPPSHGSIQTGMIPRVHGVVGDSAKLDPGTPMISTELGAQGVATAYYGNNPFGMGRLERPGKWTAFHQPNKEGKGIDCTVLMDEMLGFAKEQNAAGKRFFISSLPYEPHTPYRYHEGISEKYHDGSWGPPVGKSVDGYLLGDIAGGDKVLNKAQWSQLKALYDGEVEHMDECFGQLEDGLKEAGLAEKTAIVLTSDHGEGMFEHGMMGHAFGHYAELANVPFVLYVPGLEPNGPRKIDTVTTHLDIAPTVIDLMGFEPAEEIQGRSVLPLALRQGPWVPRIVSLEYGRSYALRAKRWKIIVAYDGTESLFDLETDPTEQKDLIESNPFALRYMRDQMGFFLDHRKQWRMKTWGSLANHGEGFIEHVEGE